jgi:hypothetical protein
MRHLLVPLIFFAAVLTPSVIALGRGVRAAAEGMVPRD